MAPENSTQTLSNNENNKYIRIVTISEFETFITAVWIEEYVAYNVKPGHSDHLDCATLHLVVHLFEEMHAEEKITHTLENVWLFIYILRPQKCN